MDYYAPENTEDGVECIVIDDERSHMTHEICQGDFLNIMEFYE